MKKKNQLKGFTLSEIIISMIIFSLIGLIITGIFNMAMSSQHLIDREAGIQAEMRNNMQNINNTVERATAIFVLDHTKYTAPASTDYYNPETRVDKSTFRGKEGWNYIGLSADGKRLMRHTYNPDTKKWVSELIGREALYNDLELDLTFTTKVDQNAAERDYEDNRLISYTLKGHYKETGNHLDLDTSIMGLNTKQVFSRVAKGGKGIALAYRNDPIQGKKTAAITLVFDVSGSMHGNMAGRGVYDSQAHLRRINILKQKAKMLLELLDDSGTVYVNMVSYSSYANYVGGKGFRLLTDDVDYMTDSDIDSLEANGDTNPGDGLRYGLTALETQKADSKYVVLLTDGQPTATTVDTFTSEQKFYRRDGSYSFSRYSNPTFDYSNPQNSYNGRSINTKYQIYKQGSQPTLDYVENVAKHYSNGVKGAYVIGFSSNRDTDLAMVEETRRRIQVGANNGGNDSIYSEAIEATSDQLLEDTFTKIADAVNQDLWFLDGP